MVCSAPACRAAVRSIASRNEVFVISERKVAVAAIQTSYGHDTAANIAKTAELVREAAQLGAQIVLPSELFQSIYFPTRQDPKWFATAHPSQRASLA